MQRFVAIVTFACVVAAGCVTTEPPAPSTPATPTPTPPTQPTPPAPADASAFNATTALAHARAQVIRDDGSVRYRVPGTDGNREAAALIAATLDASGITAELHRFEATYGCEVVGMHNVVGTLLGRSDAVFYVGAHYDTRPIADKDPDEARQDEPIQGAIDGAGGVGVVLELARALAAGPELNHTVRFVFFDGEDGGGYKGRACTDWILGSRAYVADLSDADVARSRGMILVDLVGAEDGRFPKEALSARGANAALTDLVWQTASDLGVARFVAETGPAITDDHVPFAEAGIPATDIIDLRVSPLFAAYHHTHADNVDALDEGALGDVGRVVVAALRAFDAGAS